MYLHELGDEEASFTKDDMQAGKHQEYEQRLSDLYLNAPPPAPASSAISSNNSNGVTHGTAAKVITSSDVTANGVSRQTSK